jgi:hypothetical protein
MNQNVSSFSIISNIFADPQQAYKDIQHSYPSLIPVSLMMTLNIAMILLLFNQIDFNWYVDHLVEATAGDKSKLEQDQTRQAMEMMTPTMMSTMGAVGIFIMTLVAFSITSLYFVMVSNINNDGFQFKQWFSFVSWSSLPALIGTLASIAMIFSSSDGQFAPESINPLSLNELFFNLDPMQGIGSLLASTDITVFWTITLMTLGYAKWTESSLVKSFGIVLIPYVLFNAVRLLMI